MRHRKYFWRIIALSLSWFLVLLFGLFVQNWNLTKIAIALSFPFLFVFLFLFFKLTQEEKQEMQTNLAAWQNLLDPLTEGIVIYRGNKILFANQKLLSLVRLSLSELTDLELGTWLNENPRYKLLGDIFYPFVRGEQVELLAQKPETLSVHFRDPERHFLLVYADIKLDQEYEMRIVLDQTKEVLQKREEKEFISLITHHLRTPLNHIRWFLESLPEKDFSEADRENLQSVRNTVSQLILIVEKLLFFAAEEEKVFLEPKMISVKTLLDKIIDGLKQLIKNKKLTFRVSINAAANEIAADERLFYLFLYTLLENAVIYNKDGGEVEVKIDLLPERPYVSILVQDTGIGIPESERERVFQKHFRASNAKKVKGEGLGLGLYLAKKIADLHGAEIKVDSKENEGTNFQITWPRKIELIPQSQA